MRGQLVLAVMLAVATVIAALPVKEKHEEHKEEAAKEEEEHGEDWELNLEYGRYLKEVVQALESDPAFRKKLETAEVDDIKSGKIARELHFVDHNVRTQLDELKRRELERLRHLAVREHEKEIGVDRRLLKVPVHIDHRNPTRFEVEDLKKLIVKTTQDLEKVDNQRRDDFKTYELEKEFERQQEMAAMDEEHRKQAEKKHEEEIEKHGKHQKLKHPGSKQQLEEVWEEQDHMKAEDFDPKTFFHLHDLDGNGYWDQMEVKALFKKELDKMYNPEETEDDMNERYEEMERMREHVFKESDTNKDNLISFDEFLEQTRKAEFEQDSGWQGLDEQELYSQQEYEAYQHQREEEIRRLVEQGAIPPPPGYYGSPAIHPAVYQGGPHPGLHPAEAQGLPPPHAAPVYGVPPQVHPNAVPQAYQQGYPNAVPQGYPQGHPNAVPQGYPQGHPNAVPQGYPQGHPNAVPQGYQQGHPNAVPQGYQAVPQVYNAVPQGYQPVHHEQAPSQGYYAVPSGQAIHPQGIAKPDQGQADVQYIPLESPYQVPPHEAVGGPQHPPGEHTPGHHVPGQPIPDHHGAGQPVAGQVAGQPVAGQPMPPQPVAGQPIQAQPVAGQPIQAQPVAGQPMPPQPVAGQPIQAQPVAGQPIPPQPAAGQPVQAQPQAAQPIGGQHLGQQALPNIQSNAIH